MSYTKQNFTTRQVLKANHLNYIENGISENADAIATNTANIATNTPAIETLNSNLSSANTNISECQSDIQTINSSVSDLQSNISNVIKPTNLQNYICYQDFTYSLTESDWVKSGAGQYYYNIPNSSVGKMVISCFIYNWTNTAGHVEASYYNGSYVQLRSNIGGVANGTVRVFYLNI